MLRLRCGQLPVVLGAAPARDLATLSFADILNEEQESGYQRPFDAGHARDFRDYIHQPSATTIPLTFNLRGKDGWTLEPGDEGELASLTVLIPSSTVRSVLARVDCQHRLGAMSDSDIPLTFQCYLGLSPREEMAIFSVINGKAKGLSSSLLDYHATKLVPGLETVQLDLYIAKTLHDDSKSVWFGNVKLGGGVTQGTHRRISLRGLQSATKLLLQRCPLDLASRFTPFEKYEIVRAFWTAISQTWPEAWSNPRTHLITKGVGVNALSLVAGDIITAALTKQQRLRVETFNEYLRPLRDLDWSNDGNFKAYGGRHGANEVHQVLSARMFQSGLALARAVV